MGIPTIDISHFYEFEGLAEGSRYSDPSAERSQAINDLLTSIFTYGAFKITGHGIPGTTIQRVFESVRMGKPQYSLQSSHFANSDGRVQSFSTYTNVSKSPQ